MTEDLLSDLWPDSSPETQLKTKKSRQSTATTSKPKKDISGFSCQLTPINSKGKILPIELKKDSRCWIMKVGSSTSYPSSITGMFMTLAKDEIQLAGNMTTDEVIVELRRVRDSIISRVADLEEKVEAWVTDKHKQCEI